MASLENMHRALSIGEVARDCFWTVLKPIDNTSICFPKSNSLHKYRQLFFY